MTNLNRRRFLALTAIAACLAPGMARAEVVRWRGRALGAEAEITLEHPDGATARAALAESLSEVERLEALFSLYRPNSALSRLNENGVLDAPPLDLVRALEEAAAVSAASDGAFDVTVQPLWRLNAQWLAAHNTLPPPAALAETARLVDWRAVEVTPDRIALRRKGMAVTLNGLAQGYITDRVSEMLTRRGFANVLVDLGEARALGPHADGTPWIMAVRDPADHQRSLTRLPLATGALATTEALGSSFAETGSFGHLIAPKSGRPALGTPSVTVLAPTATLADGLSTALAVAGPAKARAILAHFPGSRALMQTAGGALTEI